MNPVFQAIASLLLAVQEINLCLREFQGISARENAPYPDLHLTEETQCVVCRNCATRMSDSPWFLLVLLTQSPDARVSLLDAAEYVTKSGKSIWVNGLMSEEVTFRSTASRLSIRLFTAQIPYRVIYSRIDQTFSLVYEEIENDFRDFLVNVNSQRFVSSKSATFFKKCVRDLESLHRVLQYELRCTYEEDCAIIPPIESKSCETKIRPKS